MLIGLCVLLILIHLYIIPEDSGAAYIFDCRNNKYNFFGFSAHLSGPR